MTAPATIDQPLRVRLAPGPRMLLEDLFHLRRRYRRVIPTTATLAERQGVSRPTIKRWLAELRTAGMLVSIYNGGQGRRCIYYLGPRAAQKALEENPAWNLKDAKKATFGALRMGEVVRAKRMRKDLKSEILKPSDSSSTKRGTPSESPPSENQAPAAPAAVRDDPPCRPPVGDPMPTAQGVDAGGALVGSGPSPAPDAAQQRPKPNAPLSPPQAAASSPRGAQAPSGTGVRRARSIAKDRWDLWCRAWGLWRHYAARARGGAPDDHPADVGAMKSLLAKALLRYRGSEEPALDDLAWGFRAYIRDPRQRFKPLGRLARTRDEYGRAPQEFQAPWRRSEALRAPATSTVPRIAGDASQRQGESGTGASSGGVDLAKRVVDVLTPAAKPPTLLELARIAVKRAGEAQALGIGTLRAVERAQRLLRELEAKDGAT